MLHFRWRCGGSKERGTSVGQYIPAWKLKLLEITYTHIKQIHTLSSSLSFNKNGKKIFFNYFNAACSVGVYIIILTPFVFFLFHSRADVAANALLSLLQYLYLFPNHRCSCKACSPFSMPRHSFAFSLQRTFFPFGYGVQIFVKFSLLKPKSNEIESIFCILCSAYRICAAIDI